MKPSCDWMKASLISANVLFQRICQLLNDTTEWEICTNLQNHILVSESNNMCPHKEIPLSTISPIKSYSSVCHNNMYLQNWMILSPSPPLKQQVIAQVHVPLLPTVNTDDLARDAKIIPGSDNVESLLYSTLYIISYLSTAGFQHLVLDMNVFLFIAKAKPGAPT